MRVIEELVLREVAGEYVLIPTGEIASKIQGIIGLNESGVLLYEKLKNDCTKEELKNALLETYEVDEETAMKGVEKFLKKMEEAGILR